MNSLFSNIKGEIFVTYYEDYDEDYDDGYDLEGEEPPEPYQDDYSIFINEFVSKYSREPINKETLPYIKNAYKEIMKFSHFFDGIQKEFVEDVSKKLSSSNLQKKFITEIFLFQFKGLSIKENPQDFLKVLYEENTKYFAELANKYGNYQYIMQFIDTVMENINKTETINQYQNSIIGKNEVQEQEQQGSYEYSDVYYWEAVHDGEITPTDYLENFSNNDDSDFDYYDEYHDPVEEKKKYSDPQRIASNLEKYIKQLEVGAASKLDVESKKMFLTRFKAFSYTAKKILEEINIQEHVDLVLPKLQQIAKENQLTIEIDRNYDKHFVFHRKNGDKFIDLTFFKMINDKDDWSGNELSFHNEYVEKTTTDKDLNIVLEVMNAAGYQVGSEYKNHVQKAFKCTGFDTHTYKLPSGLKIEMINHGNELRQFFRWADI